MSDMYKTRVLQNAMSLLRSTVYLVTEGEYFDYSVLGVFSSSDNAEEFKRRYDLKYRTNCDISSWDLDPVEEIPTAKYIAQVTGALLDEPRFVSDPGGLVYYEVLTWVSWQRSSLAGECWRGQAIGATPELALKNLYDAVAKERARVYEEQQTRLIDHRNLPARSNFDLSTDEGKRLYDYTIHRWMNDVAGRESSRDGRMYHLMSDDDILKFLNIFLRRGNS